MLFPEDWEKAHAWHARFLARRPLPDYLEAGHDFSTRWADYLAGVANSSRIDGEEEWRWAAGALAGRTVMLLWALICDRDERAGWSQAIEITSNAARAQKRKGSPSHIRSQLRRFSPVLHLWGAWAMCDTLKPAGELMAMSGALLSELRNWDAMRPVAFRHHESYLAAEPVGPWAGYKDVTCQLPVLTVRSRSTK